MEVSGESESVGVSRDTKTVGVEDSAMESGMGCRLGGVKENTPGRELASLPCRKKFHSQHGGGTLRTTEACRGSGSVGNRRQCGRSWIVQQQTLTAGQEGSTATISQEAEGADADKAAGQYMKQEAAQELLRRKGHHPLPISVGVIFPAERDLVVFEGDQAMVGDGDAMGVAAEIAEEVMGAAERWFGIDHPVLTEQGAQESAEGLLVL